jgi:hypothetical protein
VSEKFKIKLQIGTKDAVTLFEHWAAKLDSVDAEVADGIEEVRDLPETMHEVEWEFGPDDVRRMIDHLDHETRARAEAFLADLEA